MEKGEKKITKRAAKVTVFFGIFSFYFLISGLFLANSAEKEVGNNVVLGIDVNTADDSTQIIIRSQNKPAYSSSTLEDSPGAVVEISDANVSELAESIPVGNGFVKEVNVAQFGEYAGFQGRVEIVFEKGDLPYTVEEDGNNLLVSVTHLSTGEEIAALPPIEEIGEVPEGGDVLPPPLEDDLPAGEEIGIPALPEEGGEEMPPLPEGEEIAAVEGIPVGEEIPPVTGEGTEIPGELPPLEGEEIMPLEAAEVTPAPVEDVPLLEGGEPPLEIAEAPPVPEEAPGEELPPIEAADIAPLETEVAEAVEFPEGVPAGEEPLPVPEEIPIAEAPPFPEEVPIGEAPPVAEEMPMAEVPPTPDVEPMPVAAEEPPAVAEAPVEPLAVAAVPPAEAPVEELAPSEELQQVAWIEGDRIQVSKPIKFLLNEAVILPESLSVVDEVLKIMQENVNLRVRVEGHTDSEGPARYNQALSEYRAIWIKLYLSSKGISPDRIQVFGYGESRPIADNESHSGREKNRRVEFRIVGR